MKQILSLLSLYRPRFNRAIISLLQASNYRIDKFLASFWRVSDFNSLAVLPDSRKYSSRNEALRSLLDVGGLAQLAFGILLIILGAGGRLAGGVLFGVAAIISYPIVWAHLLVIPVFLVRLPGLPKSIGRQIVLIILGAQVRKLRTSHDFKLVAVAGSVGKTSTKFAIAGVLESKLKVRWQAGNYNDPVTVPLVFFGESEPSLLDVLAWLKLFRRNSRAIKSFDYDVVVVELGTDAPGTMARFSKYLQPDIGVVTAVAPEHMEFFVTLENVASEELLLAGYSDDLLVNFDLVASEFLENVSKSTSFAINQPADFRLTSISLKSKRHHFVLQKNGRKWLESSTSFLSKNQLYGVLAASAVASKLGLTSAEIAAALEKLEPVSGRLKPLKAIKNSTILDDSYNSAPEAAIMALETLYKIRAPQKIAVLGSMNELGDFSEQAHKSVGEFCDPKKLEQVVTIGADARRWLAPAAKDRGCKVKSFDDPYAAGAYVKGKIKPMALVLVKGSQNGVFAEEAVKLLLKNKSDTSSLVRQSPAWQAVKDRQFSS